MFSVEVPAHKLGLIGILLLVHEMQQISGEYQRVGVMYWVVVQQHGTRAGQ